MNKKILLIENEASLCNLLYQWLIRCEYNVVLATAGGDEGILLAVTEAPDLIIIDTNLPVIDGWQTIKILKASAVTQNIPIIALTKTTTESEWNRISESGCNACELKPIDQTSLLSKIKALTEPIDISADTSVPGLNPVLFPAHQFSSQTAFQNSHEISATREFAGFNQKTFLKSTVVYVDDSPTDSQAMEKIVQKIGCGYESVSDPLKALPLLLEIKPKLIFLDLVMPFTNGYEICAQIRRTSTFKKTPIIIVTSNGGIIDRVRARFVGASGFFSKPVMEERVLKVLKKHLKPEDTNVPKTIDQPSLLPFV